MPGCSADTSSAPGPTPVPEEGGGGRRYPSVRVLRVTLALLRSTGRVGAVQVTWGQYRSRGDSTGHMRTLQVTWGRHRSRKDGTGHVVQVTWRR